MADYDVIVLGGGSAGTSAARAARAAGASVAMFNDGELGGLCILRGCMPTKSMLEVAHALHEAETIDRFGIRLPAPPRVDFARIMERKDAHVARFRDAKVASIEGGGYDVIDARARFAPGGGVEAGGRSWTARAYVIATGSVPDVPAIPGIDRVEVWTSDDVMRLTRPPSRLLVLGAGAIGLELAQFFARVGTEVTLVSRSALLHRDDRESGDELAAALSAEPRFRVLAPANILGAEPDGDGLVARVEDAEGVATLPADAILVATGRTAALEDLGLAHVGLAAHGGLLAHDDTMRTEHEAVYVAGDATGSAQILHVANREGRIAGHNAAGGDPIRRNDTRLDMQVIFTDPPFAAIGATPGDGDPRHESMVVSRARFPETGRAITMGVRHGLWKLWADRDTGEVLGSTILGPRADDLIHQVALLMRQRMRASEILELPWYHPTLSEVFLDLARDLTRRIGDERRIL